MTTSQPPKVYSDSLQALSKMLKYMKVEVNKHACVRTGKRRITSMSLMVLALEHASAVLTLLEQHHYHSAAALLRAQYEAYLRGVWLQRCASDSELERYLGEDKIRKDGAKRDLSARKMVEEIEREHEWSGALLTIHSEIWAILNSFTHGGTKQINAMSNGDSITPQVSFDQIIKLVAFCKMISQQSLYKISEQSENEDLNHAICHIYKTWGNGSVDSTEVDIKDDHN